MEHVLPGPLSVVLPEIDTDGSEIVTQDSREKLRCADRRCRFLGRDLPDVAPMSARDDEQVTPSSKAARRDNQ
jgi:hypothetical protein